MVLSKEILQDPMSKSTHGTRSTFNPTRTFSTGNQTSTVVSTKGNPIDSIKDLNINIKHDPESQHR